MSAYNIVYSSLDHTLEATLTPGSLLLIDVLVNEMICHKQLVTGFPLPPVFPLVGSLHQLRTNAADKYLKWAKEFRDVYQVRLRNIPVIVIKSAAAARIILGHNSQATASRPELYTYHKIQCTLANVWPD